MTTPSTELREFAAQLNPVEVDWAAAEAVEQLDQTGHALVDLTPGDATLYRISIIQMEGSRFWVGTQFGPSYEWGGHQMPDPGYVQDKWINPNQAASWTAKVLCVFLSALAEKLWTE